MSVQNVTDPAIAMADHHIVLVLNALNHRWSVLVAKPEQSLANRFIALGRIVFQCSHRIINLSLQEPLEGTVQRCHEDRLPQLANDLGENVRSLILHGKRHRVELGQLGQNPQNVVVVQGLGSLEILETLSREIILQYKLLAFGAIRGDHRWVVVEHTRRLQATCFLKLFERRQHDVEYVFFALEMRRTVVETPT